MPSHIKPAQSQIISFSGIDGAGKSTQIDALRSRLTEMGLRVHLIAFWDDVATLTRFRESAGKTIFKGESGIGTPSAPVERRDKNVRSPLMTCVRMVIYLFDAISLRRRISEASRSKVDVIIFDRYLYDELANLPLQNPLVRGYVRLLLKMGPNPQIAFLLDADPVAARARKPEYPLDFLHLNRKAYLTLSQWVERMAVIAPNPIHEVERDIFERTLGILPFPDLQASVHRPDPEVSSSNKRAALDRSPMDGVPS